jgi:hypothetical protein
MYDFSRYGHLVEGIKFGMQSFRIANLVYVKRETNTTIHGLAREVVTHIVDIIWMEEISSQIYDIVIRDLILVQHQYNNCTTTPYMRVGSSMWDPPSCEGLLYNCCIGVVNLTFSL